MVPHFLPSRALCSTSAGAKDATSGVGSRGAHGVIPFSHKILRRSSRNNRDVRKLRDVGIEPTPSYAWRLLASTTMHPTPVPVTGDSVESPGADNPAPQEPGVCSRGHARLQEGKEAYLSLSIVR
jgi:hypothetical protein